MNMTTFTPPKVTIAPRDPQETIQMLTIMLQYACSRMHAYAQDSNVLYPENVTNFIVNDMKFINERMIRHGLDPIILNDDVL